VIKTEVLILGAGLAGMSTAYHLDRLGKKGRYLIVEKGDTVGGRANGDPPHGGRRNGMCLDIAIGSIKPSHMNGN